LQTSDSKRLSCLAELKKKLVLDLIGQRVKIRLVKVIGDAMSKIDSRVNDFPKLENPHGRSRLSEDKKEKGSR
jgi:hypothetical protein